MNGIQRWPPMLNQNYNITSYDGNQAILNWSSANADDVSYIFVNGVLIAGNVEFSQAERFILIPFQSSKCIVVEIHDFDTPQDSVLPITVPSNKIPLIGWESVADAVKYKIYANNKLLMTVLQQNSVQSYKKAIITPEFYGKVWTWHTFTVTSVDQYGNESVLKYFPYFIYDLPPIVQQIEVTNGSGAGLYNFTITL